MMRLRLVTRAKNEYSVTNLPGLPVLLCYSLGDIMKIKRDGDIFLLDIPMRCY